MSLAPGWGPLRQRRTVGGMRSTHLMGTWPGSLLSPMLSLWLAESQEGEGPLIWEDRTNFRLRSQKRYLCSGSLSGLSEDGFFFFMMEHVSATHGFLCHCPRCSKLMNPSRRYVAQEKEWRTTCRVHACSSPVLRFLPAADLPPPGATSLSSRHRVYPYLFSKTSGRRFRAKVSSLRDEEASLSKGLHFA